MEGIAIGINLSGNMISDVKQNRNIIVMPKSCVSWDGADRARYTIYRQLSRKRATESFGLK